MYSISRTLACISPIIWGWFGIHIYSGQRTVWSSCLCPQSSRTNSETVCFFVARTEIRQFDLNKFKHLSCHARYFCLYKSCGTGVCTPDQSQTNLHISQSGYNFQCFLSTFDGSLIVSTSNFKSPYQLRRMRKQIGIFVIVFSRLETAFSLNIIS